MRESLMAMRPGASLAPKLIGVMARRAQAPTHQTSKIVNLSNVEGPQHPREANLDDHIHEPHLSYEALTAAAMSATIDPRMMSVQPRIRYNTIGGINGPLVVLDNVRSSELCEKHTGSS
jgi:hypothetical protein